MDLQRSSSDADLLQHRSGIDGSVLYVRVLVAGEHLHAFEWSVNRSEWLSTHQDCSVLPQDQQVRDIAQITRVTLRIGVEKTSGRCASLQVQVSVVRNDAHECIAPLCRGRARVDAQVWLQH